MNLHRAEKPDWVGLQETELNRWQRVAKRTNGFVTPASFISLAGLAISIYGLYLILFVSGFWGAVALLIGRIFDILDGIVADHTKTKSPVGESIDVTVDKTILGLAIITIIRFRLVPLLVGLTLAAYGIYNSLLGIHARYSHRGFTIHPSAAGKISNVFMWSAIILFILVRFKFNSLGAWHTIVYQLANICFVLFVITAIYSSLEYTRALVRQSNGKTK